MPSVSEKQKRFMRAVSHNPEFAKEVGVPQTVGKDFEKADEAVAKRKARSKVRTRYGKS
jgi:hypothetical protein